MSVPTYIFYPLNSQYLQISGLKDESVSPATYVNDAVLTATMFDSTGTPVVGCEAVSGVYQTSSNGVYRFPVSPTTFNPTPGGGYTLVVSGSSGGRFYDVTFKVKIVVRQTGVEV